MSKSIVYTNDNCIGCNKCIKVCSAIGACVSKEENGKARIDVDETKCVACGSCIDVCVHGAREFVDDTERFFEDLKKGENISLLLAPAFKANFPDEYKDVLGGLKSLGVNRIINVSFGADITTWGYLNYIDKYDFKGGISQPCPALVSYIERYIPELLDKLFPVQSPLICAAIYARKELGINDKFAFISPCIAKKLEIEDVNTKGMVSYNVTFEHLMSYVRENNVKGPFEHTDIEYGLGAFYPTPGGLAENVRWFLGDSVYIRQIEGERHLYDWLHINKDRIKNNQTPFLFIDALNCEKGCICGTAVNPEKSKTDDALYALLDIREEAKKNESGNSWSKNDKPEERLSKFNEQFKNLNLSDYLRSYTDKSDGCKYVLPNDEELESVFFSMNKFSEESRHIDCTCCGYESCRQMATAIFNGFNHKENCIYYEKTMVHELEMEKAIAEEANQAKSAFLANMSHEIRTPINAVLGMNEMVLRECADPDIIAYSENIKNAGNTLLGLVNNILDISKIEAGKMDINPSEYDLSLLLNDLVCMVQNRIKDKGLILSLDFDKDIPKNLYGDEIRIKQILINLLTNAVKYTEKGTITFKIGYEKIDDESICLNVCISDTGIGIKEEDLSKLFEKFDRIEEKRNRNIEGTGLGMNITLKLLEMMDSKLDVESKYGSGTQFSFSLKQKVVNRDVLGSMDTFINNKNVEQNKYTEKFTAPEGSVLIMDDNPINLMVFKSLLKRTGLKIDTANDAYEGLLLASKKKYDIIFFDHMMPGKDGVEAFHDIRSQKNNPNFQTPAICITANAISGAREYYLKEGFDDYISKPIDSDALESIIIRFLPDNVIASVNEEEKQSEKVKKPSVSIYQQLASIRNIDFEKGIQNSGDFNTYLEVLKIFYDSIDSDANEIENAFNNNDLKNFTIKVHAIKSTSGLIGATDFSKQSQIIENAGKAEDTDYINDNFGFFINRLRNFKEILRPVMDSMHDQTVNNQSKEKNSIEAGNSNDKKNEIRKRILIVDDNPVCAKNLREWLKDTYKTDVVTTGNQALNFVAKAKETQKVDLILLDYEMPDLNGKQVFENLKEDTENENTKVVFITGEEITEVLDKVSSLNPSGVLSKDITREDLLIYLKEIIK